MKKVVFKIFIVFILFISVIPLSNNAEAQKNNSYIKQSTSSFGIKNEPVYTIGMTTYQSRQNKLNLKDLEGKLITNNGTKIVRLIDSNFKGDVLYNEGPNSNVISVKSSISEIFNSKGIIKSCNYDDYLDMLLSYGISEYSKSYKGKKYKISAKLTEQNKVPIYGDYSLIPSSDNRYKNGQWEYAGISENGGWVPNHLFPKDDYAPVFPDSELFRTVAGKNKMIGVAGSATWLRTVYSGDRDYSKAEDTISRFKIWKLKESDKHLSSLTDKRSASFWLKDKVNGRVKIQSLYQDELYAGLGVTQYTQNGRTWYQTYLVKPKWFPDCSIAPPLDIKANSLNAKRSTDNANVSFKVTNNSSNKKKFTAKKNVPWSLEWEFSGYDTKGKKQTKSGAIADTKSPFSKTFNYGTDYSKSYSFNPKINKTWEGSIEFKANVNPKKDAAKEVTYTNNIANTVLMWNRSSVTPPPQCEYEEAEVEPRYTYELDLAVTKIQADTTPEYNKATTPVTVFREDYSSSRNSAKEAIKADIAKRKKEKEKFEKDKEKLEGEQKKLESDLAKAQQGYPVEKCYIDDKGKEKCDIVTEYDHVKIASLMNQIQEKKLKIAEVECKIKEVEDWIKAYEEELQNLEAEEQKNVTVNPNLLLTYEGDSVGEQNVSLREGETKVINFEWMITGDGYIEADINENREYTEYIEGIEDAYYNNILGTDIYVPSNEISVCSSSASVSGIVHTENSRTISGENFKEYYEYLSGGINNLSPSRLRAGYGFTYNLSTNYSNEWNPLQNGIPSGASVMYEYTADSISSTYQDLDRTSSYYNSSIFEPMNVYVAKRSGLVFESPNPTSSQYDPTDPIINGGRKWYSNFNQKDGTYPFTAYTSPVGVNNLALCLENQVEIKGTAMDDFVRRSVLPDNPFPAQDAGWNWKGKEANIKNKRDWFYK